LNEVAKAQEMKISNLEKFLETERSGRMASGILPGVDCESDFDDWRRRGVRYMSVKNDTNAMLWGFQAAIRKAGGQ